MPNPATLRERRLRMTKAQLIDEIDRLEQRAAAIEAAHGSGAPMGSKARDRNLADYELADLARFPPENPNPVLRVMPDGAVLYANDAAIAVKGVLSGRKNLRLVRDLARVCAEASRTAEVRETEFESGDRVFAFSIAPIADEAHINIYGRDITERKRAEQALRESEHLLASVLDNMPAIAFLKDQDGRYKLVNHKYEEIYQVDKTAIRGKTTYDVHPKPRADDYANFDREVIEQHRVIEQEQVIELAGAKHYIATNVFPIFDLAGKVSAIGGVGLDITERKRAEQALREQTEFLLLTELITRAANEAASVDEAVQIALDQVCAHTGWPVGHAYMLDEAEGDLAPSDIWHLDDNQRLETFRSVTEATRFASGVGLPGRVLASGQPAWIFDVTTDPNFPRAHLATEIGVRAGAAFPVLVGAKVVAVLEFFSAEAVEAYEPLMEFMAQIGTQLGRAIERQRAEQALRESEALFKTVVDNMPAVLFLKDLDGRFRLINRRYEELYGVRNDAVRGKTLHDVLPRNRADTYAMFDRQVIEQRRVIEREITVERDGKTHSLANVMYPIFDLSGNMTAYGGFELDITDINRAEIALRESEARFKTVVDNMPAVVFLKDLDGRFLLINRKYEEMYETTHDAVHGSTLYDILPKHRADAYTAIDREVIEQRRLIEREVTVERNGKEYIFTNITFPIFDLSGELLSYAGIEIDITERKHAEEALAGKESQLRVALDYMPGGIRFVDEDRNYVFVNARYLELYDFPEGLLKVGEPYRFENLYQAKRGDFGPGDPEALTDEWLDSLPRDTGPQSWERTTVAGRVLQVSTAPTPIGGFVNIVTDITERKQAEQALRESQQLLDTILDHMPMTVYVRDLDGRFMLVNRRYEELHQVTKAGVHGKTLHEVFPKARADDYATLDPEVARQRRVLEREEAHWLPDGEHIMVVVKFPIFDIFDEVVAVGGIDLDITERKQAGQRLAEKEAQLRTALDNMPGGMFMIDKEFRFQVINERIKEFFDLPGDMLQTGGLLRDAIKVRAERGDYGSGNVDELVERRLRGYTDEETLRTEERLPGGRVIELLRRPTDDGGTVAVVTDITENKRAEEALRENEALLKTVLDNMPAVAFLKSLEGHFRLINRKYEELYGVTFDSVRGKTLYDIYPKELADDYAQFDRQTIEAEDVVEREIMVERDGEEHVLTSVMFPVFDQQGTITAFGGIEVDITERKRAEEALLEAKRRTEEASKLVAEKNRMLESLSNQLSKYLSPQVYASIFSGEQSVEIASKRKKLTVFFSDIADFTGTTDSLESEELTNLLNRYLTEMSKIALDHGATIDKYVGDAIIAFFGDPETRRVKEDARTCVNMAIAMQRRMRDLQSEWLDMGLEKPFELRIGINTGFCTVGNFGSEDRMDYTIIGNEVNLAARLESLAEVGGILLAHETHSLVKDTVMAEEGDALTVKGFVKPVRTYSDVGLYDDLAQQGRIIHKEQDGLRILLDLDKQDRASAIAAVEDVFSQLKS